MAFDAHSNFAVSTVATAPSPAISGISLVVAAGEGARFPAVPFNAVICPNAVPTPLNAEVVRVTNRSTDTLTITRAQESSSARTVVVGDRIFAAITAKTITDVESASSTLQNLIDAKGDLLAGTADNTAARVAAGANGTYLRANSAATPGVDWQAPFLTGTHAARVAASHKAGTLWKETDTGLIYLDDGTNWIFWKGEGKIPKTADQNLNSNSTTLQNVTDLVLPVEANERWFVEVFIFANFASATGDLKVGWTFPSGLTATWAAVARPGDLPTVGGWLGAAGAPDAPLSESGVAAVGTRAGLSTHAFAGRFIAGGNAGSLQLQAAQNTATVETDTILRDSWMRVTRLA